MSRDNFNLIMLLRAPFNMALNVSRDGASTTSLGNLGQGLTILSVKNFFLISRFGGLGLVLVSEYLPLKFTKIASRVYILIGQRLQIQTTFFSCT